MHLRRLAAFALLPVVAACASASPPAPLPPPAALPAPPPAATAPVAPSASPSVSGIWLGTLAGGGNSLRVQLRFDLAKTPAGCSLDSLDQDAFGIPCTAALTGTSLSVDVPAVHGTLLGIVSDDGNTIKATWSQGEPLPLALARQASPIEMATDLAAARKLDAPHRRALVDAIAHQLQAHYVLPALATKMIAVLRAHAAHGDYDAITDAGAFVDAVTKDLYDVGHNGHLRCIFSRKNPPPPPAEDLRAQGEALRRARQAIAKARGTSQPTR